MSMKGGLDYWVGLVEVGAGAIHWFFAWQGGQSDPPSYSQQRRIRACTFRVQLLWQGFPLLAHPASAAVWPLRIRTLYDGSCVRVGVAWVRCFVRCDSCRFGGHGWQPQSFVARLAVPRFNMLGWAGQALRWAVTLAHHRRFPQERKKECRLRLYTCHNLSFIVYMMLVGCALLLWWYGIFHCVARTRARLVPFLCTLDRPQAMAPSEEICLEEFSGKVVWLEAACFHL